jgi:hypothetical protein
MGKPKLVWDLKPSLPVDMRLGTRTGMLGKGGTAILLSMTKREFEKNIYTHLRPEGCGEIICTPSLLVQNFLSRRRALTTELRLLSDV